MTNTTQREKKSDSQKEKFSNKVLELSRLKEAALVNSQEFGNIQAAHGALIEDKYGNIFFDLRMSDAKPFWGHTLPLFLTDEDVKLQRAPDINELGLDDYLSLDTYPDSQLKLKQVSFLTNSLLPKEFNNHESIFLHFFDDQYIEYSFGQPILQNPFEIKFFRFINDILQKGGLLRRRLKEVEDFCNNNSQIDAIGLNIVLNSNNDLIIQKCHENCLHITRDNFFCNKIYLNIPLSFTKKQRDDCFFKITNMLKEATCL